MHNKGAKLKGYKKKRGIRFQNGVMPCIAVTLIFVMRLPKRMRVLYALFKDMVFVKGSRGLQQHHRLDRHGPRFQRDPHQPFLNGALHLHIAAGQGSQRLRIGAG